MMQTEEYAVRGFETGDRTGFYQLFEAVFGDCPGDEWFNWKYAENPYVDHVPMQVAVDGEGKLVGARPLLALPLAIDGERRLGLQPGDTMVHPDHRRRGLFTRMTQRTIETYADHEAAVFFNFPNEHSQAGYEKLGWREIGTVPTYYRIQRPSRWLSTRSRFGAFSMQTANVVMRAYLGAKESVAAVSNEISVTRHESVPAGRLASLYADSVPNGIHADRDERYLLWRYGNPDWEYRSYLAREAGDPVGAAVVGRRTDGGTTVRITDVVPVRPPERVAAALLATVIEAFSESDAILAPSTLPRSTLAAAGFRADTEFPLSVMSSPTTLVARPAADDPDAWSGALRGATDVSNWTLTFTERDTS